MRTSVHTTDPTSKLRSGTAADYIVKIGSALLPPQVHASADSLKLITFDADGTLYADGAHMEQDNQMIAHIINLMRSNVQVQRGCVLAGVRISGWVRTEQNNFL